MAAAEQTLAWPEGAVPSGVVTSPLVERIRRGVIGESELMDGPFGPRRVTYADYTASGRTEAASHCAIRGQNGVRRVIATRIEPDGTMQRRMVDTARQSDRRLWEDLAARAAGVPVPYRPAPGIAVSHIKLDDYVVMVAEHDLAGPLLDLVAAVMGLGSEFEA